ncbi:MULTISPECIES: flagellar assembly protein FliH [Yersinia]|uniref:flagellar assembly protein FliH n=1 Tax=Yersinia TaxID=629 RepID=UPI0005E8494C|nr:MULTISPECIES: flagellar assembly protein FliH [Yersinia]RXA97227.1 flagellar assembly protein H [Yersinia sp. 2105 StPb PI]CNK97354.1 lateral flagellar export/assembly protein [Yersinia frederiksenii]
MLKKNSPRAGEMSVRVHQFPPLRQHRQNPQAAEGGIMDPAEYQKQLMEGFQEGVSQGFSKGLGDGKEEGYQEGVRLGYDDGVQKGKVEGRQLESCRFNEAVEPFSHYVAKMRDYLRTYENRRRDELLQLVEKVTRQVIRCELALQPAQLLALVEEALAAQPAVPTQLKVYLNPTELGRINDVAPEKVQQWGLVADADMVSGECRVVTDTTEIDVGCQHRLDQCVDALKNSLLPDQEHG